VSENAVSATADGNANATTIVIFGASGDLTGRKLVPALYHNYRKGRLPERLHVIGFSRTPFADDAFREKMRAAVMEFAPEDYDAATWDAFARVLHYQPGDMNRVNDFQALERFIHGLAGPGDGRLYYLATAPELYPLAIAMLGDSGMARESERTGFRRVIIEKPFGHDLGSARALNARVHATFDERQVYRIDHYLGKETVQNILVLRFGNAIFEPLWNRNYVDHVQISVAETVGVGHRAAFYEKAGVLRDMFQNHLLQLLTLIAMEPPVVYAPDALRNEKVKVLRAIRAMDSDDVRAGTVRGRYVGYESEPGVDSDSDTATFAAVRLFVDNWRWEGVPFYLRSGKRLARKSSEITITFRRIPHLMFSSQCEFFTNSLTLCIQPNEGLHLRFATKIPDKGMEMEPAQLSFTYRESFGRRAIPEAYERLLLDAMNGDATLFARSDEIELAWTFIDAIAAGWNAEGAPPLLPYEPGTWGPDAASGLLTRDGRQWAECCGAECGVDEEDVRGEGGR